MWLLAFTLVLDSATVVRIPVAPAETLSVTSIGEGPPLVLIPGLFGAAYGFRKVIPGFLELGYRVIVIEPLAVGSSSRPAKADYSLTAQAARIGRAMDTLGLRGALVVAHSLGSSMALRLAWRRPELISGLVLLEGGPVETAASPGFRRAMTYLPWVRWAGGVRTIQRVIRKSLVAASGDAAWVDDEVIRQYTAGAASDLDGTLLAYLAMAEAREPERLEPHLAQIACPVRVLLGGARHAGGPGEEELRRLRTAVPQVVVATVPEAGHHLHEERPDRVVEVVRSLGLIDLAAKARP